MPDRFHKQKRSQRGETATPEEKNAAGDKKSGHKRGRAYGRERAIKERAEDAQSE